MIKLFNPKSGKIQLEDCIDLPISIIYKIEKNKK